MYVLSHAYVFPNTVCFFSVKSFSLGSLPLLTNFQKLFTVSNTISIVHLLKDLILIPIKIFYCRGGQLIWLSGPLEQDCV